MAARVATASRAWLGHVSAFRAAVAAGLPRDGSAGLRVLSTAASSSGGAGNGGDNGSGWRWTAAAAAAAASGAGAAALCERMTLRDAAAGTVPEPPPRERNRKRVVVLGSGFGANYLVKDLEEACVRGDDAEYEVVVVSPRNYFLYSPLLPAAATGAVEFRSIVEPMRRVMCEKGTFYQARAEDVDPVKKTIRCRYNTKLFGNKSCNVDLKDEFTLDYDILVVAVGSLSNTFNTPGVEQHTHFLKNLLHARGVRSDLNRSFELASHPGVTEEEQRKLCTVVVVGGGPTGVELAAEIYDMVKQDVERMMPHLADLVTVKLINTSDHILSAYDKAISKYATEHIMKSGIELVNNARVQRVEEGKLVVKIKGELQDISFGTAVWCTGIKNHPLTENIKSKLDPKLQPKRARGLVVDEHMAVLGADGIFAIGDAAVASGAQGQKLPATAQVAHQEGSYLAELINKKAIRGEPRGKMTLAEGAPAFDYTNFGQFAYLGQDSAAVDMQEVQLTGKSAGALWRGAESALQCSVRNRLLVSMDWIRVKLFGRDFSNFF